MNQATFFATTPELITDLLTRAGNAPAATPPTSNNPVAGLSRLLSAENRRRKASALDAEPRITGARRRAPPRVNGQLRGETKRNIMSY